MAHYAELNQNNEVIRVLYMEHQHPRLLHQEQQEPLTLEEVVQE